MTAHIAVLAFFWAVLGLSILTIKHTMRGD
jgi:hypothetical protein